MARLASSGRRGADGGAARITRRGLLEGLGAAAATAALPQWLRAAAPAAPGSARKPNFVIIFTDDQGYQDLGCFGSPLIKTPNVDRMAAEGMKLTDFYVASPVCSPSRSALLTGCYPKRVGMHRGVLFPGSRTGLNPSEITIAELLKQQGYATCCIGKWHLGCLPEFLPTRQGFDSYLGVPYSNDMPTPTRDGGKGVVLLRDEKVLEHPTDLSTLTQRYTAEAVKFITANKDKPFFLYLPHTMPHTPLAVSGKFKGHNPQRGLYGDVIEEIDWSTGEILDAIRKLGLANDTLVIFTSDNGPWLIRGRDGGSALPLRNGKGTTYEGGVREPCVVWWPGKVPPGRTCGELAATIDLLPTLAKLAGTKAPSDRVIDGRDIWPLLSGQAGARSPHEAYYYYSSGGALEAVRSGNWKLRVTKPRPPRRPKGKNGAKAPAPPQRRPAPAETVELYDLAADIGEKDNVAAKHGDVVKRLRGMMEAFEAEVTTNARPVGTVTPPA